jgi:hypothetical protein
MAFKIGAEEKKKAIWAGALGLIAVFLVVRTMMTLFGGSAPPPAAPQPAAARNTAPAAATTPTTPTARAHSASTESSSGGDNATEAIPVTGEAAVNGSATNDPTLRFDLLTTTETTEYKGRGRNVFSLEAPPPPIEEVQAAIRPDVVAGPQPAPPPPPPPPIDLKFYGFETAAGKKRVFLLHGSDVFIAGEGEIVDRRYRVVQIMPNGVKVEDILNSNTQTLSLKS